MQNDVNYKRISMRVKKRTHEPSSNHKLVSVRLEVLEANLLYAFMGTFWRDVYLNACYIANLSSFP